MAKENEVLAKFLLILLQVDFQQSLPLIIWKENL